MMDSTAKPLGLLHGHDMKRQLFIPALALLLSACGNVPLQSPGDSHLRADKVGAGDTSAIPTPVQQTLTLPKPKAAPKTENYSVVVNGVPVRELLFALARDAKLNVDIHPGIEGMVTLNAIDQTLQQLLARIAKQVDIRWELDGPNLSVMPDKPFLRTYKIDFVNMARTVKSTISTATQIASAAAAGGSGSQGAGGGAGGNSATTQVSSDTKNDLMESLISNVTDMLKEEDKIRYRTLIETEVGVRAKTEGSGQIAAGMTTGSKTLTPEGATKEIAGPAGGAAGSGNQQIDSRAEARKKVGEYEPAVSVFANRETGVLIVRATSRQHEKVQQFIDQVMNAAKRQVLIEATIVEVNLNNNNKQGINWSALRRGDTGFSFSQAGSAGLASANPLNIFTLTYANPTSRLGNLAAEISLLESFGNVKVLSSPKLSVMNNQTATLKVADNKVYFSVKAETTDTQTYSRTTYTTTANSVSVGFIMNVTPQINDGDEVTINVRPTITRITGYVNDPNPALATAGVVNRVPEIQTREMESIIKIGSGQIAVMGGLMQEELNNRTDAIPGAGSIPILGNLFKNFSDGNNKTELVIFLRPIVVKDASIQGDYAGFRANLPGQDFFEKDNVGPQRQVFDFGSAGR
jgi:general secretion pathway protein D